MAIPEIPNILTPADWNKQKGIIAKMAGETGLGAQMTKLQSTFNAVNWERFDANAVVNAKDLKVVDDALAAAKAEYPKVENVRKELRVLEDLAKRTEAKFKSNRLIPSSSVAHVGRIAAEADRMAVACKSMDAEFKRFEEVKNKTSAKIEAARNTLKTYLDKCQTAIKQVDARPTDQNFLAFHKEHIRGLNAALAYQKDLSAYHGVWRTMSSDGFKPKAGNSFEIKKKLKEVQSALDKLKAELR
jgi:hypothetical protein